MHVDVRRSLELLGCSVKQTLLPGINSNIGTCSMPRHIIPKPRSRAKPYNLPTGYALTNRTPVSLDNMSAKERKRLQKLVGGDPRPPPPRPSIQPKRQSRGQAEHETKSTPYHADADGPFDWASGLDHQPVGLLGAEDPDLPADWGEAAVRDAMQGLTLRQSVRLQYNSIDGA